MTQLSSQQYSQIVNQAWNASTKGGAGIGGIGSDDGRSQEAGQSGGSNPQALSFAKALLQGLQGAGCTTLDEAIGPAQEMSSAA